MEDLDCNPLRALAAQRAMPVSVGKRLAICRARKGMIDSGGLDQMEIYRNDAKLNRPGLAHAQGATEIWPY